MPLLLLFLLAVGVSGEPSPRQPCNPADTRWYPTKQLDAFLFCDVKTSRLASDRCFAILGVQKIFDVKAQRCIFPPAALEDDALLRKYAAAAAGSGRVGDACSFNTDCISGMFCDSGLCNCMTNYVQHDKYCYEKINPSQAGCTYDRQCSAVWPGSTCSKMGGIAQGSCHCPPTAPRAIETRDGWVCVQNADACALPQGAETRDILLYSGAGTNEGSNYAQCSPDSSDITLAGPRGTCHSEPDRGDYMGETYDCIRKMSNEREGLCCPNRAFTCTLPMLTSGVGETRWWFNSVTGTCSQFSWSAPSGGSGTANSNNFKTKEHCESFCKNICTRGNPEYESYQQFHVSKPRSCSASSCDSHHDCETIGSQTRCCPKPAFICSRSGGLINVPPSTQGQYNFNPGVRNNFHSALNRYYYDSTTKVCRSFQWYQQGGNFNNFGTKADCDSYCSRLLCPRGDPLRDQAGNTRGCSNSDQCPGDFECSNGVCCPRKQTVCAMPKQIGTCGNYAQRYWYNAITKDCELFTFSGCQGNANNFDSLLDCQNFCRNTQPEPKCLQGQAYKDHYGNFFQCSNSGIIRPCPTNYECYFDGFMWGCCPSKTYTCSLPLSIGVSCGPKAARWSYDTTTQQCQTFEYLGCDGNSNNFASRENCELYCGVGGCPNGGTAYTESGGQARTCSKSSPCPTTHDCIEIHRGNAKMHHCCPSRAYICSLPPTEGHMCGSNAVQRYYFNIASKDCSTFFYNGCGTNGNNFATLAQCSNYCLSAACGAGEMVYVDPNTQEVGACNVAVISSCPAGFQCKYDTLTTNYVCCGASDMGVCPAGEKAFIDPLNQNVKTCTPNMAGNCPSSFLCRFNVAKNAYYCCSATNTEKCPGGRAIYQGSSGHTSTCTIGSTKNQCPDGYSCQSAVHGAFDGHCCTEEAICPDGKSYYSEPSNGKPRLCSTLNTMNGCPDNFTCTEHEKAYTAFGSANGYCCEQSQTDSATAMACGDAKPLYGSNGVVQCSLRNPCPDNYSCVGGHCCSVQSERGCPEGSDALTNPYGEVQTCSPYAGTGSCPEGYACHYNEFRRRYQCCGREIPKRDDGCPKGQIAYLDETTQAPRLCQLDFAEQCAVGYGCLYSNSYDRYQCCGLRGNCPAGSVAFVASKTGREKGCDRNTDCPPGFACIGVDKLRSFCCTDGTRTMSPTPETLNAIISGLLTLKACPKTELFPLTHANGRVRTCSYANPCPSGYECEQTSGSSLACCASDAILEEVCRSEGPVDVCDEPFIAEHYYYDYKQKQCISFPYRGCTSSANHFLTQSACMSACKKYSKSIRARPAVPVCPVAGDLAQRATNGDILECARRDSKDCAPGFTCQPSPGEAYSYVCCGHPIPTTPAPTASAPRQPDAIRCPISGFEPIMTMKGTPVGCATSNQCAAQEQCQFSVDSNSFICCAPVYTTTPAPQLETTTAWSWAEYIRQSKTETPTVVHRWVYPNASSEVHPNAIPTPTYPKASPSPNVPELSSAKHLSRRPATTPNTPDLKQEPQPTMGYGSPQPTMSYGSPQPSNHIQPSIQPSIQPLQPQPTVSTPPVSIVSPTPTSATRGRTCPAGSNVYLMNKQAMQCHHSNDCPRTHQCMYSSSLRRSFCCNSQNSFQQDALCPSNNPALFQHNIVVACNPTANLCPPNYTCIHSRALYKFICCQKGQQTSQPTTTTQPPRPATTAASLLDGFECLSQCSVRLNNCPKEGGYSCQWNPENEGYQCCRDMLQGNNVRRKQKTEYGYCSNGNRPFLYPGARLPLICDPSNDLCPSGFQCDPTPQYKHPICCSTGARVRFSPLDWLLPSTPSVETPFPFTNETPLSWILPSTDFETPTVGVKSCPTGSYASEACSKVDVSIDGCCYPKRHPGESCVDSRQCSSSFPQAHCNAGKCQCPSHLLAHTNFNSQTTCLSNCPVMFYNDHGVCRKIFFSDFAEMQRTIKGENNSNVTVNYV